MRSTRLVRLLTVVGILAAVASSGAGARAGVAAHGVDIVDFAFEPRRLDVEVGEPVTWTNQAGRNHTVTSEGGNELDSGELGPGEAYGHVFEEPGTYRYLCQIHPDQMTGVVRVVESTATVAPGTPEPTPPTGTLPPNFSPFPTLAPVETPPAASSGPATAPAPSPAVDPGATSSASPALLVAGVLALIVVLAGAVAYRNMRTRRS